jgi:hypothetical protein
VSTLATTALAAQSIEGHLLDGVTREPVPEGIVSLLAEDGRVLNRVEADSVGFFSVVAPGTGSYYLRAERIGYATKTDGVFDLGPDGRLEVEFYVLNRPVELDGFEVTAERTDWIETRATRRLRAQGFFDRQKMGFGYFTTPEDIEKRPPMRSRDLFRIIPGMAVGNVGRPGTDGIVTMSCGRGGFAAYVNGIQVHLGRVWDMRNDISIDDIAAVEVYPRVASIPLEYNVLGACGVILLWTK